MPETISIAAFQNGDKEAFNHVFNMFYKRICFFAAGIVNEDSAEDIVQDAFIKLWERRNSFDNLNAIKAFLYLTTKNSCINTYKHQKVVDKFESAQVDIIDESNIIFHLIEAEVLEEVQQAVQQLPQSYRKVIYLSYFQGLSNQETADHLNVSINTVKTQKVRSLRILREILKHSPTALVLLVHKIL
ncbi:RNA polymerase sigma-70 factor [Mucilaginibacter sabulilitoris]|uniref:RNA polymerase sigma-70 factor n=1 Tax=Mucilaginibacter sabulilitoris TaxID=1173583 RepID=A0ABZ0TT52_9SPHI|nr:RNA polymerase sigma-70 factor [Mucilaginibacter sabulilitoris]WPU94345.1 RNA polymerase sigma-70 factor [Mucilaginibacter sabulilitoris]